MNNANRYDSPDYLAAYKGFREFPKIHDDLFAQIERFGMDGHGVDVCCSIGLLGQRVIDVLGVHCVGVEFLQVSIDSGKEAGVTMPMYQMGITPETLDAFIGILKSHGVTTLIARRAISEVFPAEDHPFAHAFVDAIYEAGVRRVFLQGRAVSKRSAHPMYSIEQEAKAFRRRYKTWYAEGQIEVLGLGDPPLNEARPEAVKDW